MKKIHNMRVNIGSADNVRLSMKNDTNQASKLAELNEWDCNFDRLSYYQFHSSSIFCPSFIFSVPLSKPVFLEATNLGIGWNEGRRVVVLRCNSGWPSLPGTSASPHSVSESSNSEGVTALGNLEWHCEENTNGVLEERDGNAGLFSLDLPDESEDKEAKGVGEVNAVTKEFCMSERSREALF